MKNIPAAYQPILEATRISGFTMASDLDTGSLLCTLAASKPGGRFLELGTGTGLSTSWILQGMDAHSTLISVDNEQKFLDIAADHLGGDQRLTLEYSDGGEWLEKNRSLKFDYIFADTWHGKYLLLDLALDNLLNGGIYIIDDMLPQPNWPAGHDLKAQKLRETLREWPDFTITELDWSTGIIIGVKNKN
ncbi:MAG: class I SAM-dependent methyltransferase [Siphonobacter sp.]